MIEICDLKSFDGKMNEPDRDGHLGGGVCRDFAKGVGQTARGSNLCWSVL